MWPTCGSITGTFTTLAACIDRIAPNAQHWQQSQSFAAQNFGPRLYASQSPPLRGAPIEPMLRIGSIPNFAAQNLGPSSRSQSPPLRGAPLLRGLSPSLIGATCGQA